ncbi:hypothetical protein K9M48_05210 [Candidatus Gracilibacteria bacterium]|nr:hypothetical protein [Candidatus Gracilibacteria bacterium]
MRRFRLPFKIPIKSILKFIWIFSLVFVFIYFVIYLFRSTLFKPDYYIYNVNYSSVSIEKFDDPALYKIIKTQTKGENYYILKFFKKSDILDLVRQRFPMVSDIEFSFSSKNTLDVDVIFDDLNFRVIIHDKVWGLYKGYTFLLYSGNSLGRDVVQIELPGYLSGLDNLKGLFFDYSFNEFEMNMNSIIQFFGNDFRFVYFPGSARAGVFNKNSKVVYLNFKKDIKQQLDMYDFLIKYADDFSRFQEIDLGSLDGNMVIVRKK